MLSVIVEIIAVVMMLGEQFNNQMQDNFDTMLTDVICDVNCTLASNRCGNRCSTTPYLVPLSFPPLHSYLYLSNTKRQSGSINVQPIYLTAAIRLLFVLTDGEKNNQILFRAAIAQNQYYIRRPDEFEICTQSEY